jgi:hypothetical protein
VVTLAEKLHRFRIEDVQHVRIGWQVVSISKRFAGDGHELGVKDPLPDPKGPAMELIPLIG